MDGSEHYETIPCKPVALHVLTPQSDDSKVPQWICCMVIKQAFEYKTMGFSWVFTFEDSLIEGFIHLQVK